MKVRELIGQLFQYDLEKEVVVGDEIGMQYDELITEITIENQIFNVTLITGKISCNEQPVAQCQMKIFINQS